MGSRSNANGRYDSLRTAPLPTRWLSSSRRRRYPQFALPVDFIRISDSEWVNQMNLFTLTCDSILYSLALKPCRKRLLPTSKQRQVFNGFKTTGTAKEYALTVERRGNGCTTDLVILHWLFSMTRYLGLSRGPLGFYVVKESSQEIVYPVGGSSYC